MIFATCWLFLTSIAYYLHICPSENQIALKMYIQSFLHAKLCKKSNLEILDIPYNEIDYFGTFWLLLTTFGIENGSMITLLIFGDWTFAKTMCNIEVDILKLKITWPIWSFFTF